MYIETVYINTCIHTYTQTHTHTRNLYAQSSLIH